MKYTSIPAALFGLYNWARQDTNKAVNYQFAFGIKSNLAKSTLLDNIVLSRMIINEIESLCNLEQLSILKYYYGFADKFASNDCLYNVGIIAYSKNVDVGMLVAQNWRDSIRVDKQIATIINISAGHARKKINESRATLESVRVALIDSKNLPANSIETILINNNLLSIR